MMMGKCLDGCELAKTLFQISTPKGTRRCWTTSTWKFEGIYDPFKKCANLPPPNPDELVDNGEAGFAEISLAINWGGNNENILWI